MSCCGCRSVRRRCLRSVLLHQHSSRMRTRTKTEHKQVRSRKTRPVKMRSRALFLKTRRTSSRRKEREQHNDTTHCTRRRLERLLVPLPLLLLLVSNLPNRLPRRSLVRRNKRLCPLFLSLVRNHELLREVDELSVRNNKWRREGGGKETHLRFPLLLLARLLLLRLEEVLSRLELQIDLRGRSSSVPAAKEEGGREGRTLLGI